MKKLKTKTKEKKRPNMVHVIVQRMEQEKKWRENAAKAKKQNAKMVVYGHKIHKCQTVINLLRSYGFDDMKFDSNLLTKTTNITILLGKSVVLDTLTVSIFGDGSVVVVPPKKVTNKKGRKSWHTIRNNLSDLKQVITRIVYKNYK